MARIVEESYIADLKKWADVRFDASENGTGYALWEVAADLERMPSVVHCKDCKWYTERKNKAYDGHFCERIVEFVQPDDFCSYGERKDNER